MYRLNINLVKMNNLKCFSNMLWGGLGTFTH